MVLPKREPGPVLYQSLDYVSDKATVFHSSYISATAKSKVRNAVALGHFILPPACLHKEIRRRIGRFIWEQDSDLLVKEHNKMTQDRREACREENNQPVTVDSCPSSSTEHQGSRTEGLTKLAYCPLQNYPVNNMVTGYISVESLRKFSGQLHDFTPGSAGYLVYRIQDETCAFSDMKNKLKRK
ncbi:telomere repeats-binding bouquet formation protein 2 isoform X2 [Microcaecilia unicolor]|uniref:Telomere repeats-binding bouquet formation protein 2-like isoform X2 n=1 Tax=Microcaecilia unicolor TaxID=1415580 RepID=A0A6P7X186_9AMPH|nr:telomere repeats-binding bouquet formation protein 2-like isoform X2 [Microcaecilia unicolor]XP_030046239.1 telomere repeats-binding bouquet formation protein 2-like isoform X2 [Microcaecilia unicolor]